MSVVINPLPWDVYNKWGNQSCSSASYSTGLSEGWDPQPVMCWRWQSGLPVHQQTFPRCPTASECRFDWTYAASWQCVHCTIAQSQNILQTQEYYYWGCCHQSYHSELKPVPQLFACWLIMLPAHYKAKHYIVCVRRVDVPWMSFSLLGTCRG